MARAHAALLAWLPVLLSPGAGHAADAPASPGLRLDIDGGSASLHAPLAPNWSLRTTLSARYGTDNADPTHATLHRASVQAGLAYELAPQAQLELAVQRGLSPDMPARSLALNWRLRY